MKRRQIMSDVSAMQTNSTEKACGREGGGQTQGQTGRDVEGNRHKMEERWSAIRGKEYRINTPLTTATPLCHIKLPLPLTNPATLPLTPTLAPCSGHLCSGLCHLTLPHSHPYPASAS
ncbi:hypothetical protein E2C01_002083 [Portunus trituberculatus]|uniref:Uncharacterized protein n=1 Tax=Portunus trituberculatus TaxID=210409 RepID=A0A5B7CKZ5_PORTR|nr:hypothetical protein [Portunus trituberculatus]